MSKCLLFKSAKLNAYNNGVKNGLFNLPENFTPEKLAEREGVSEIVLYPIHTMLSVKGNKLVYNSELKKASNILDLYNQKLKKVALEQYGVELGPNENFITILEDNQNRRYANFNDFLFDIIDGKRKELGIYDNKSIQQPEVVPVKDIADGSISYYREDFDDQLDFFNSLFPDVAQQENVKAQEALTKLANRLVDQVGIGYQMVSAQEATDLTKDTTNPWNGEPAFFYNNNIYFVEGGFKLNSILHEFSHPIVRSLGIQNPTLFNNLYNQYINSSEGAETVSVVETLYPDLSGSDLLFREEVLVRALEKAAVNKVNKVTNSNPFNKFITNMLFAIKQLMRKLFGDKIKLEKLSETTTIDQLSDMLLGDTFILTTEIITPEDVVQYMRSNQTMYNDLQSVNDDALVKVVNRYFTNAGSLLSRIRTNKNYSEFVEAIKNESGRTILQDIVSDLRTAETLSVDDKVKKFKDELDRKEKQITSLVRTTIQTDILMNRIIDQLTNLNKMSDTKEVINNTFYYDLLVRNWTKIMEESINGLTDAGLRTDSSLFQLFSRISEKTKQADRLINSIYKRGVGGVLEDVLTPLAKNVDEHFETKLKTLRENNAPAKEIKKTQEEWDKLKLNRATIDDYLSGMRGDVNSISAYVESFASSPDPIISSFAVYVDNAYTDVELKAKKNKDEFISELLPALKAAGYSDKNITDLMKDLVYEDSVVTRSATGEIEEFKKLVFLNPWKGYQAVIDRLQFDIEEAKRLNDVDKVRELNQVVRQFYRDYMNDEYVPEFYAKEKIYDSDLGRVAYERKQNILAEISDIDRRIFDELTEEEAFEQKKILWQKYSQLAALRDESGNIKTGDDLEISKIEKKYREESRKFYEWKEITGLFQYKLDQYKQDLLDQGLTPNSDEFKESVDDWVFSNTRVSINEDFYKKKQEIIDKIKTITDRLPANVSKKLDVGKKWEEIIDIVIGFRNDDGQPVGSEMSEARLKRIKQLQEEINDTQNNLAGFSGLSPAQFERYIDLSIKLKNKTANDLEKAEFTELNTIRGENSLDQLTQIALKKLYSELASMQSKEPTDDYLNVFNSYIERINPEKLAQFATTEINKANAEKFLKPGFIAKYLKENPEFKEWYLANHIVKEVYNMESKVMEKVYSRIYVWNVTTPVNKEDYNSYTYNQIDPYTGESEDITIQRIPKIDFYRRSVKKKYRTGYDKATDKVNLKVGKHIDNRGNWLPRTVAEGAKDDLYVNKQYFDLKNNEPKKAEALDVMVKYHLLFQENKTKYSKLWLDVPRFRKLKSELVGTSLNDGAKRVKGAIKSIKDSITSSEDDFEQGINYNEQFNLVRADIFDEEISSIPVQGLYKLDSDKVSLNVPYSMLKYMYSLEHQKKLIELNPIAQALQKVVNNPENGIKDLSKINSYNWVTNNIKTYVNKKGKNLRAEAINTFIEREFKGKSRIGLLSESSSAQKLIDSLQSQAVFGLFAMNIFPSAIKNFGGAITQIAIESAGQRYLNKRSYLSGQMKAFKMMSDISANIYTSNPADKSIDLQLIEVFDPIKGRFEEKFGTEFGRSVGTDLADSFLVLGQGTKKANSVFLSPRKWLENEGTLSLFAGMMIHQKVPQTINGVTNYISYMDTWEKGSDGILKLKAGIDETYDIGGAEFKNTRNRIQETSNALQGAYGKIDKSMLDRYAIWRMFSSLRRFFTRMFVNNWSPTRYNVRTGDLNNGYMLESAKLLKNLVGRLSNGSFFLTDQEKYAGKKVLAHSAVLGMLALMIAYLFGYDPDDEDRFEKMRQRSGDLLSDDFNAGGWLVNHALVSALGTRQEALTFINPREYVNIIYSGGAPTLGPIVDKYKDFAYDGYYILSNDSRGYYTRDVGPYSWQAEGSAKIFNDLGYLFGLTGSQVDPIKSLKGYEYQLRR
jgi:hypothetical protein